jgi:hypothetical protein
MSGTRRKPFYWRRKDPAARFDIAKLRPKSLERGERFETPSDAREESVRSQMILNRLRRNGVHVAYLRECGEGHYHCEKTFCPLCARTFRRYFTGQLLRLNSKFVGRTRVLVVLLENAPRGRLEQLRIERFRQVLRKRLDRAGLSNTAVIGGFEICYRASSREWVLHVNLVIFGGDEQAIAKFVEASQANEFYRPVKRADLEDHVKQLSYVLKFGTYHRPQEQRGPAKAKAVPLNPAEHLELVRWMAQYEFTNHLFLFNARRRGVSIELSNKDARKA